MKQSVRLSCDRKRYIIKICGEENKMKISFLLHKDIKNMYKKNGTLEKTRSPGVAAIVFSGG